MKIIVISTPIFTLGANGLSGYGGLEQIAWQCATGLASKGHEVSLVAPEGSVCPNVTPISNGVAGTWDEKSAYGKYWEALLTADVIIDHTWNKWSYILKEEGRLTAPVLGVCHAPINTMYQTLPAIEKPCFVCISKDQANHFEAIHGRPAEVCYNGIDLDYYKPMRVQRSDRFLFLARFSSIKGPDLAIEACLQAGVGLDLVGDTSLTQEPDYLAKCQRMADGEQIRFVGPATRGECVWWFSQAFTLLHPNKTFREPFGLAPVEALACECPVIAWDYGAMSETVGRDGRVGHIVRSLSDMVEAIKEGIQNRSLINREEYRSYCRKRATGFSVQHMVNRYETLCQKALEGGW